MSGARWILGLMAALAAGIALPPVVHAQDETLSPYFFVESGDPHVDRLPLLGTRVAVNVAGVMADVTVRQTYRNDGTRPIHAKYVFPASTRAAVHGLTMTLDQLVIRAEIKERGQAKKEYTAAKKAGKNAALLEQQRPNVFSMNVANIMPGQVVDVELEYTELLVPAGGTYAFVYPTVVGPRYSEVRETAAASTDRWLKTPYLAEGEGPTYTLELEGSVGAGMPIDEMESPSHSVQLRRDGAARVDFALDPSERFGGNRDFVLRYRLDGGRIQSGLLLHDGGRAGESFFLMMLQPPRRVAVDQIPPREYVFIVDVSGSMRGFPLDTSKELLRDLIGGLRPTDAFNVLFFSGGSQLWSPQSRPASRANIEAAVAMLDQQRGGGGTRLFSALQRAMALPHEGAWARSIIVVTDGYIAAEKQVFTWIRDHLGEANVFAFGIGTGVNRYLIEGVAKAGLGEPFVVTGPGEARSTAERFREYVEFPVLTGVRIAFEGLDAYDITPPSIPDVLAERPVIVHGKWKGERSGRIRVTGTTGAGRFEHGFDVSTADASASNGALRYLWARSRIADISDFSFGRETDEERRQLVELGLTYNLLTKYTSFIAVHDVIRNDGAPADDVVQPLPLPAGVTNAAVGTMGKGSEPELVWLVALALAAGLVVAFRRRGWVSWQRRS